MLKTRIKSVIGLGLGLVLSATAMVAPAHAEQEVIKWRLQAHLPVGSGSWQDSVVAVKDKLYERTNGRLQIELHSADSLFGATEIFPAVRRGVIEMGYTSPAYLMSYIPTAGLAFALPGAFEDVWEALYFWKHLGFEELVMEEAAAEGIHYYTDKLYPTEMVLKRPVESMEEFSGLRIRGAGLLQKFLSEVGASATYIPGPEIYHAVSTGVVDGAHWGASQEANSLSLYEVAKYHVRPSLGIGGVEAFIINDKAMSDLPEDIQQVVKSTLVEHFWARTNQYQYQEKEMLNRLAEEEGVQVITLPEEVQERMWEVGRELREVEAQKSPSAAEAVRRLEAYLEALGRGA
ncbi:TRAP transporter substrate-binding protein DctP [uncultured Marinobacter sp.]|uniref:TRAP transporter substrate-binding protein DctP n=1 Tax=uncultured Marinobacter sp. TaxID=187379 RepID=UPI0030D7046E